MIYGRGEDDTSSIKILVYKQTKEAMASPSLNFIMRTPWVERLRDGISLSAVRITWPFLEITTISSSSFAKASEEAAPPLLMTLLAIKGPVLGVMFMVLMPEPPRFCVLYSLVFVVLP